MMGAAHRISSMLISLIAPAFLCGFSILAGPTRPNVDIQTLCRDAGFIVAGLVTSVEVTDKVVQSEKLDREQSFVLWQGKIAVRQAIKGQCNSKEIIVEFPGRVPQKHMVIETGVSLESLYTSELAIVFLESKEQNGGSFLFTNPYKSTIRLADSVAVQSILSESPVTAKPEGQVAALLTASIESLPDRMVKEGIFPDFVSVMGNNAGTEIKKLLEKNRSWAFRGWALVALADAKDFSLPAETVAFLQTAPESDPAVLVMKKILSSRMALLKDKELVEQYYPVLLQHPHDFVRLSATRAIRGVKLRSVVPQLVKGLEDPNQDVRYQSLMALAGIFDRSGKWAPGTELFRKNETEYVRRWQAWWNESGRSEFSQPAP